MNGETCGAEMLPDYIVLKLFKLICFLKLARAGVAEKPEHRRRSVVKPAVDGLQRCILFGDYCTC